MTLDEVFNELEAINRRLVADYGLENKQRRVYARLAKVMEELGELADEVLADDGLQRKDKGGKYEDGSMSKEVADLIFAAVLLGMAMELDVKAAMEKRLKEIRQRMKENRL